jgi:C-terminal processing protease CtpA/Prc
VYVVINQNTFSAGEGFAYDMKVLHRATLIGETTGGGANPSRDVWLNDHFSITVPLGTAINPYTGTNWDGTGVAPDLVVDPENGKAMLEAYILALKSAKNSFPPAVADRNAALQNPAGFLMGF